MIDMLKDHWGSAVALAGFIIAAVKGWMKLNNRIDILATEVKSTGTRMDSKFADMKLTCQNRLGNCTDERCEITETIDEHMKDTDSHSTPAERELHTEWRDTVMKRFDRLESLILGRTHANK